LSTVGLQPRRWLSELSGALGDSGVFVPLALALIAVNGLHPTPVFLVFGVAYAVAGLYYRVPVPIQPLKAMVVIVVSMGASGAMITMAALEMAFVLGLLALTGGAGLLERVFSRPLVRGVQLGVGLLLVRKAVDLAIAGAHPGSPALVVWPAAASIVVAGFVLLALVMAGGHASRFPLALVLLGAGAAVSAVFDGPASLPEMPRWSAGTFDWGLAGSALVLLVIPQLPLTLGNAVVAASATARDYFGRRAARVTPRALCTTMGLFNVIAALVGGFPVCHGSGGFTAHYRFGARTGWGTFGLGVALAVLALAAPTALWSFVVLVPAAVIAAMLAYIGLLHAALVRDVLGVAQTASPALLVGVVSLLTANLMIGIAVGAVAELALYAGRRTVSSFR
jgi:hypothetical protein